jgi:GntR family transcriptional regulator / MocR family aminotransferase
VELPLTASRDEPGSLAAQLVAQLRAAMMEGRLARGERLPATRAMAAELGVSRTVIKDAYAQLFAEGWIEGRHGSGTYVAGDAFGNQAPAAGRIAAGPYTQPGPAAASTPPPVDLRPGIPWAAGIDRAAWRRAWRSAGFKPPGTASDPAGIPELRHGLSAYLRRARGIQCAADQILVTGGVAAGLSLIAAALLRPGDRAGVEEPGYPVARAVLAAHGVQVVPCPVDADGLVVSDLPAGLKLVYTTPAHQYPLGGRLPIVRRQALTAWARAQGAMIVEDDYDGEFRYDVAPLPALSGLDPEAVIYLGSTTKTFTPALRLGWLAAAPPLITRLADAAGQLGGWAAEPAQQALLTLLTTGDLERHIRRMRHEYARRRAAVTSTFADGTAGRLLGDQAGLHVVLHTPHDAETVAAAAGRQGVAVGTLNRFYASARTTDGLVVGYGGAPLPDVARGCRIIHQILSGTRGRARALPDCLGRATTSGRAYALYQVLPASGDPFGGLRASGEVGGGQVEQQGSVEGGGELDGQHVDVGIAEVHLPEQAPDVRLGHGGLRTGWYGLVAVEGGASDVAVRDQEAGPGLTVGNQAVQRRGARAQRWGSCQDLLLEGPLVVVQERGEDPGAGAEPAEHGPLAQACPLGQRVHGQLVRALFGEHLPGRSQQVRPVADGVGALGLRRSPGHLHLFHGFTLRPEY